MGYKYSFLDNETYGTDDINAMVARVTTSGVSIYPEGKSMIDAMNSVTSELIGSGVGYGSGSCYVSEEDGMLKVNSGVAFFDDGVTVEVDDEGIIMEKQTGKYLYFYRDINQNTCDVRLAEELPPDNYVLLCYINDSGEIVDKRHYAKLKVAPNAVRNYPTYEFGVVYGMYTPETEVLATIHVGYSDFSKIVFRSDYQSFNRISGMAEFGDDGYTPYLRFYWGTEIRFKKDGDTVYVFMRTNENFDEILEINAWFF